MIDVLWKPFVSIVIMVLMSWLVVIRSVVSLRFLVMVIRGPIVV